MCGDGPLVIPDMTLSTKQSALPIGSWPRVPFYRIPVMFAANYLHVLLVSMGYGKTKCTHYNFLTASWRNDLCWKMSKKGFPDICQSNDQCVYKLYMPLFMLKNAHERWPWGQNIDCMAEHWLRKGNKTCSAGDVFCRAINVLTPRSSPMRIILHKRHERFVTSFSKNHFSKRQLRSYSVCIYLTISYGDR